jgi:hypothetical protein
MSDLIPQLLALLNYELEGLDLQTAITKHEADKTKPKNFEYTINYNGKNITISSIDSASVMDIVYSLQKNPPVKTPTTTNLQITPTTPANPASLEYNDDGNVYLHMNNKKYSGSGALIIITDIHNKSSLVILFKDSRNKYHEPGGYINKDIAKKYIKSDPENILFMNAHKYMEEESVRLFVMKKPLQNKYIDIQLFSTNELYRLYLYIYKTNNSDEIKINHEHNKRIIRESDDNYENYITDMDFFYYNIIQEYIDNEYVNIDAPYGIIQTDDGINVRVAGRTLKILKKLKPIINVTTKNDDLSGVIGADDDFKYYQI